MQKIYYTDDEVKNLVDCEVQFNYVEWRPGYKFLRRACGTITVVSRFKKNTWIITRANPSEVRIDGKQLEYISRYRFTNSKKPFATEPATATANS